MASIAVNYAALSSGHDGLLATWGRIESNLAELDSHVSATADMTADTLLSKNVESLQTLSAAGRWREARLRQLNQKTLRS